MVEGQSSKGGQRDGKPGAANSGKLLCFVVVIGLIVGVLVALVAVLLACIVMYSHPGLLGLNTHASTGSGGAGSVTASPYSVYLGVSGNKLLQVDPQTDKVIETIRMSKGAGDAVASPDGKQLYICNGRNLTVLNTRDNSIVKEMSFDESVAYVERSPDGTRLYVNYAPQDGTGCVAIVDASTYSTISTVKDVPSSWGTAISLDGKYLYLSDYWGNKLTVIDTQKGCIVHSISCGKSGNAADVAVSPDGRRVYVSIWSASYMAVINTDTMTLEDTVLMNGRSSAGVTLSPDGRTIYLSCCDDDSLLIIDAASKRVTNRVPVGKCPRHVRLTPDGRYLYIFSENDNVMKFDTDEKAVVSTLNYKGGNAAFPAK